MFPPDHPAGYSHEPPWPGPGDVAAAVGFILCGMILGLLLALVLW